MPGTDAVSQSATARNQLTSPSQGPVLCHPSALVSRELRQSIADAGLIWLFFSGLRWTAAVVTEYVSSADHGRLQDGLPGLVKMFSVWDGDIYVNLATNGYFHGGQPQEWIAFFPGLPLVIRSVAWVATGGELTKFSAQVAGVLIANLASLIASVLLYRFSRARYTRRAAVWAVVLLMVWPTAVFLNAVYTESLFLLFALGAWHCAWRGRWWWAGLLCACASLVRINGVILAGALMVMLVVQGLQDRTMSARKVIAVCCGVLGTLLYFVYLHSITGDWLAWSHALEKGWLRHSASPSEGLQGTLQNVATQSDPFQKAQSIVDIFAVALTLVCIIYFAIRRYILELAYTLVTVAVLVASNQFLSVMRYTLIIFPIFVVGGYVLSRGREWIGAVIATLSAVWMVITTVLLTLEAWAG